MNTMWFFGFVLQVTFLGDGPLGQMTSISSAGSFVKGFVGNPLCQPPLKDNGRVWFTLTIFLSSCHWSILEEFDSVCWQEVSWSMQINSYQLQTNTYLRPRHYLWLPICFSTILCMSIMCIACMPVVLFCLKSNSIKSCFYLLLLAAGCWISCWTWCA